MCRFAIAVPLLAVPLAAAACGGNKSGSASETVDGSNSTIPGLGG